MSILREEVETLCMEKDLVYSKKEDLELQNKELDNHVDSLKQEKHNLQKQRSKWKKKIGCQECEDCSLKDDQLKRLNDRIKELEINKSDECVLPLMKENGIFTVSARKCVLDLLGLGVSAGNVAECISSVASNLFNVTFSKKDLPSSTTCINICNEGFENVMACVAEKIDGGDLMGVLKDGTSKKKDKVVDGALNDLTTGETISLGMSLVTSETGQAICNEMTRKIETLIDHSTKPTQFLSKAANSLVFYMSDRAGNERKSNRLLDEWKDSKKENLGETEVHHLYCMAHVLLGFSSYVTKDLEPFQKALTPDGSGFLGRHSGSTSKKLYKALDVPSRVCFDASEAFAPVGSHLGVKDVWAAQCREKPLKSKIKNYKDNRFNGIFQVSYAVSHHHDDFKTILNIKYNQDANRKLKGLKKDLYDEDVMVIIRTLAFVYVHITEPYWKLITRHGYQHVVPVLQKLRHEIESYCTSAQDLDCAAIHFESLEDLVNFGMAQDLLAIKNTHPKASSCLKDILGGMLRCMKTQLRDILDLPADASLLTDERLKGAPATNLIVERNFGSFDASLKRRPNARLRYHSSIICMKKHRRLAKNHMDKMSRTGNATGAVKIRILSRKRRRIEMEREREVGKQILATFLQQKTKKAKKAKKAKKTPEPIKPLSALLPPAESIIKISSYVLVAYPDAWYPGIVKEVNKDIIHIDFAYARKAKGDFNWPDGKDMQYVKRKYVFAIDVNIKVRSGGRFFELSKPHQEYEETFKELEHHPDFFL